MLYTNNCSKNENINYACHGHICNCYPKDYTLGTRGFFSRATFFFPPHFQTIMDRSLKTLLHYFLGHFPVHTNPTPPLTPQTTLDVLYQKLMLRVLSGVPNTKKQMKARGRRPSAFTVLFLLKQNKKICSDTFFCYCPPQMKEQ